ncbi:MAG: STAS domain-containing protein [Actinomycetota bacterium]|nr:STAS domain-containing protein [Actinomycetota bacterium]
MATGDQLRADTFTLFDIETISSEHRVELQLVGELDVGTAAPLRQALRHASDDGVETIVLDLSALKFIDSTGLHELVVAQKRQQVRGGQIVLQSPTAQTRRVLEIVGLDRLFTIR